MLLWGNQVKTSLQNILKVLLCSLHFKLKSNLFYPHGPQHSRLPCPSPPPRVCSDPCALSQWCHVTFSSSASSFSSCLQSFPTSGSFPISQLVTSGGQKDWSFSFSINASDEYSGLISFRTEWFDLLLVQGTLKCLLQHHSSKASVLQHSAFFMVQLSLLEILKSISVCIRKYPRWFQREPDSSLGWF